MIRVNGGGHPGRNPDANIRRQPRQNAAAEEIVLVDQRIGGAERHLPVMHGDADTAIAIRTAVIQDNMLHVQAGGGVVYDSDPDAEWQETMNKGRALFRAVAQAAKGL